MNIGVLEKTPPKLLEASYAHCHDIARRSASSFYYSFLLLPERQRRAMCALYAFLRRTDDLGDCERPLAERRHALALWRQSLHRALSGEHDDPLLPALVDTVHGHGINRSHLEEVIDGVEMDLEPTGYENFAQLETYCHRVASAVGLACLPIWGCNKREAIGPARSCGLAFQLTNILRDLKEDADAGRFYLPREDFARFGYSAEDLRAGIPCDRFRELMRYQIARADGFYETGSQLMAHLSADGRRVFGSMLAVYRTLLAEIKRRDGDVLSTRVQLSRWQKMRIASQWIAGGPSVDSALGATAQ